MNTHAVGRKYSTIPAPIDASRKPTYISGLSAAFGGWINIETSTFTSGAPPKTERHDIHRQAAGPERPDDAGRAGRAEGAGNRGGDQARGVETRQVALRPEATTGMMTPIRK